MSKFRFGKGLPLYAVISAVIIIAGIILSILLGFHYASEEKRTVEVSYDAIVTIADKEEELENLCETVFRENGVSYQDKQSAIELDSQSLGETGVHFIRYTFAANESENALKSAALAIRQKAADAYSDAEITVSVHYNTDARFYEAIWRGAIALAVAAIVVLVYVGIRYGAACAITGLIAIVNDTLFTLGIFVIARIPVYAYAPLLFAGLAAVFSIVFWIVQCFKLRENSKDPSFGTLSAEDAVAQSCSASYKSVLCIAIPIALAFALIGGIAVAGTRLFFLSALIPLAVGVYSSLLLAPAVLVPLKTKFDRLKATKKRYTGKQKASAEQKAAAEE